MQNKALKKMMKTTTKFINKNRHILCIIVCLILVILLVILKNDLPPKWVRRVITRILASSYINNT